MRLVSDYIHPTPRGDRCRIRIYLPEEERDAPVRAPYLGETRLTIGEPSWKSLDREAVEALVGHAV